MNIKETLATICVKVHIQQIRDPRPRMLQVSAHIGTCANNVLPKYYTFSSYKMYSKSITRCTQRVQLYDGQRRNSSLTA